jgi:hypothetical protein
MGPITYRIGGDQDQNTPTDWAGKHYSFEKNQNQ